jgi:hypothetical protein
MWKIGDRVWGRKASDAFWCTGIVRHQDSEARAYVIFDDGDDALLDVANIKPFAAQAGQRVVARLPLDAEFRQAAIRECAGDKVQVRFADGAEEWTSYGMIRLPADETTGSPMAAGMAEQGEQLPPWQTGDRVFAAWHDLFWYSGTVLELRGDQVHVVFDQGNQALVVPERVRGLDLEAGDRVFGRYKGGPDFFPGQVSTRRGEVVHVEYDDGDEETTLIRLLRLERDEWLPPSEAANVHQGDRVLGCWFDGHWYPGIVLDLQGKRMHVIFDDGDQALLTADKLRVLDIKAGDRVFCRRKGGPAYFPGVVANKKGEVIQVQYDDGDEETTSLRLIRLPADGVIDAGQRSP